MRKLVGITTLFAGLALLFSAGAMPAYAEDDPNGANGTVKIHDWPEHKNSSDMANDPKVCQFEIHGFKFDRGQAGRWWIQEHKWDNGDASKAVLDGSYGPANANGDWTSGPHKLADGHYKLFVEMTHTAGNSGNTVVTYKMKVFKVECATPPASGGTNTGGTNTGGTNTGGTNTGGTNTVNTVETPAPRTVAGFESAPVTGQIGFIVELAQQPAGVAGSESAPAALAGSESAPAALAGSESAPASALGTEAAIASIASLPATSTGAAGLGLAGLAITGLGFALLRRQPK